MSLIFENSKKQNENKIIEKNHNDICTFNDVFSNNSVLYGDRLCLFNNGQYNAIRLAMYEIMIYLPFEIIDKILGFTEFNKKNIGKYGLSKYINYIKFSTRTKYGRSISTPMRLENQDFVKGSGFNADRFDGGYYCGYFYDTEKFKKEEDYDDDFVVDDDCIEFEASNSDNEEQEYMSETDEEDYNTDDLCESESDNNKDGY